MNCPNVPSGVKLYVRLAAAVARSRIALSMPVDPRKPRFGLEVVVSGRTSSMPVTPDVVPTPKRLATMSSRASVAFGAISIVLELPVCVPSVFEGVKFNA